MKKQGCLSIKSFQQDNTISLKIMKIKTNKFNNQKLSRKFQEEKVEAISTTRVSLTTFLLIHWKSSLSN